MYRGHATSCNDLQIVGYLYPHSYLQLIMISQQVCNPIITAVANQPASWLATMNGLSKLLCPLLCIQIFQKRRSIFYLSITPYSGPVAEADIRS